MLRRDKQDKAAVWLPPGFELNDLYNIQALSTGTANADQQIAALKCIVEKLCGTYGITFDPSSDRMTAHNEGKRFVGLSIVQLTKLNPVKVREILGIKD